MFIVDLFNFNVVMVYLLLIAIISLFESEINLFLSIFNEYFTSIDLQFNFDLSNLQRKHCLVEGSHHHEE